MSTYPNYPGSRPGPHAATHGPGGTDPLDTEALGLATQAELDAAVAASPAWAPTIVTLSGGGATALNGQTGVLDGSTIFTVNRLLLLNITGSGFQPWVLVAGTDAESEFVVHPANYHVTTFPYVFKKIL